MSLSYNFFFLRRAMNNMDPLLPMQLTLQCAPSLAVRTRVSMGLTCAPLHALLTQQVAAGCHGLADARSFFVARRVVAALR